MSIGLHLHYNVYLHIEPEALFRQSITHARILGGCQLFREIADDCIKCKRYQKKIIEQLMGPLADSEITISPIFYYCYVDMWGLIKIFPLALKR